VEEEDDGGGGGFTGALRQKLGPFPTWIYLLVITIGLLAYWLYEKHKNGSSSSSSATTGQAGTGEAVGAQDVPDYVFQSTTNVTEPPESNSITVNNPPVSPPASTSTPSGGGTSTSSGKTTPKPAPKSTTPASKSQKYTTVTVAKWTATNAPWNSTLSGIASHYNVKGGYQALAKLNGIKDANLIQPGQKIKVPVSS
jgi:hypothetical protein